MRSSLTLCLLLMVVLCLHQIKICEGSDQTLKIKFKDLILKFTIEHRHGKEKKEEEEKGIIKNIPQNDKDQWEKVRKTMKGTAEENLKNSTSPFDRILIMNAFRRSEIDDGNVLYQGDILMTNSSLGELPDSRRKKRAVIAYQQVRWTDGRVPYRLDSSLNDKTRRVILEAIKDWEKSLPCLKWRVKTESDFDFVHFYRGQGCFSAVGRASGRQSLSIGRGCEYHGIVLHEMGHALGLFHEQSRPDRDDYVTILKENIIEGFQYNFDKFDETTINSYGVPYDYDSIMHYSPTAFAKRAGLVTIRAKRNPDIKFGQRDRLSDYDVKQARAMYNCKETDFAATTAPAPETTTEASTTEKQTDPVTIRATPAPETTTERPTTERQTDPSTTQATPEPETTTEAPTTDTQTDPSTTRATPPPETTTERPTTERQTDPATTQATPAPETSTEAPITERQTDPATTQATRKTVITTEIPTKKSAVCVDLLTTCYKWIRKGYCSPDSTYYCYMKYFCRKTCDIWEKSELKQGAKCVDLLPQCTTWAADKRCSSVDDEEYMENMCCASCRTENCEDKSRFCSVWASTGLCGSHGYLQKNCKRSCGLCDY